MAQARPVVWAAIGLAAVALAVIAVPARTSTPQPARTSRPAVLPPAGLPSSPTEQPGPEHVASPRVVEPPRAPEPTASASGTVAPAPIAAAPPASASARTLPSPAPVDAVSERDRATLTMEASVRAAEFDAPGAADLLQTAAKGSSGDEVEALYLRGLVDARDAFRLGGSPESLAPVAAAITALGKISEGRPGRTEIARLVLQAASAAAQTERDEMRLYL
jgi:hypothetical protein